MSRKLMGQKLAEHETRRPGDWKLLRRGYVELLSSNTWQTASVVQSAKLAVTTSAPAARSSDSDTVLVTPRVRIPAARPARIPGGESSMAKHSKGSSGSNRLTRRFSFSLSRPH